MTARVLKVGFIGLGAQGGPMAQAIRRCGWDLHVWARRPVTAEPFAAAGAVVESTPAALGAACDVVGVCVVNDADVQSVVIEQALLESMRPGAVLVVHSTVSPATVQLLASEGAARQVHVLDAPVSGGGEAASSRSLTVMVGGEPAVLDRVRPVLESYGDPIRLLGPVGAGQLGKLLNNALFAANAGLAAGALALGEELGLDRTELATALSTGSARSFALDVLPRLTDPAGARRASALVEKDVFLLSEVVRDHGLETSALERVARESVTVLRRIAADAASGSASTCPPVSARRAEASPDP